MYTPCIYPKSIFEFVFVRYDLVWLAMINTILVTFIASVKINVWMYA